MAGNITLSGLSVNDQQVMNALFDPESSASKPEDIVNSSLKPLPHMESQQIQALRATEASIIRPLNSKEPRREAVEKAILELTQLLEERPDYPAAYINRAQARKLLIPAQHKGDNNLDTADEKGFNLVLADLTKAIALASPSTPPLPVSTFQAELLAKAYTHRAYIYYMVTKPGISLSLIHRLSAGGGVQILEDMASRDFYMGGLYGDAIAKLMAIATNPYAKMCGAIVKEAMKDEISARM